jgi:hypothetical protein
VRAQKRDLNEQAIVEALELHGYTVERVYVPAIGDLDVYREPYPQRIRAEVKGQGGALTDAQQEYGYFQRNPDLIWYTPDDALRACKRYL